MTESAYNLCLLYSNELVSNPTLISVCTTRSLHFRYSLGSLGNFLTTSLFAYNREVCATKLDLVSGKKKPPRTVLH